MKKVFALFLCLTLSLGSAALAADYPDTVHLDGTLPVVEEGTNLEPMTIINTTPENRVVDANELDQAVIMEKNTGIDLNWVGIPEAGFTEKINLMLASGDLPDMIWKGVGTSVISQYMGQDIFLPTEELIAQYAPNIKKILDDHPEYKALATYPDGHMYGFPYIEEMYGLTLTNGPIMINKTWLDKLGLEMPTTIDELKDVLIAFRDGGDLNGNGVDDEIPYACNFVIDADGFDSNNTLFAMMGCFGQSVSYGSYYPYCTLDEDGNVVFGVLSDAFKDVLKFYRGLQEEGLLDMDGFSGDGSYGYKLREQDAIIGVFGCWSPEGEIPIVEVRDQYVPLPRLSGEKGKMGVRCNRSELWGTSHSILTTECKYPEIMTALMNYLNEPEMAVTTNWGTVGYSYIRDEKTGILSFDLNENGDFNVPEGYESWNDLRQNSTPVQGGVAVLNEYYGTVAEYTYDAVELLAAQRVNGKDEVLAENRYVPPVLMTTEEQAQYSQIEPQIKNIVRSFMVSSILDGGVDENWASFEQSLNDAGLQTLLGLVQSAYDRYLETYNALIAD